MTAFLAAAFVTATLALAADSGFADDGVSPHAQVRGVGLDEVHWTRGFWADRFEVCRQRMIPGMWALMSGTNYSHYLQNFRIAAGLAEGRHRGAQFNDGDFHKWLEGACAVFAVTKDPALEALIEEAVSVIAAAQNPDGYLHTPVLIRRRNGDAAAKPFQDRLNFEMYNSVLSGIGLDGTNFFYVNPLRQLQSLPAELRWSRTRVPYVSSFCCPPNLVRTIAQVANYTYSKSDGAIWVNLYGGSTLTTRLSDGQAVKLTQETDYPWNGRVRLTINDCGSSAFALKLRIPGWATSASIRLNGALSELSPSPATYAELRRFWHPGDVVDLDIPMPPQLIEAHPLVEETFNQVAVKRGPVVYCLESLDLPQGVRVPDVVVPANIDLVARYDGRLLNGVAVVEGNVFVRASESWTGQLYRKFKPAPMKSVEARFIPYYAWANRGKSEMTVWLALGSVQK